MIHNLPIKTSPHIKKTIKLIGSVVLFLVALANTSQAQPPLRTWHDVVIALQGDGIALHHVNWAAINLKCMRSKHNTIAYNTCKYHHARANKQFTEDKQLCMVNAEYSLPDLLAKRQDFKSATIDTHGNHHTTTISQRPIGKLELSNLRMSQAKGCMRNLGWNSADNWQLGR